MKSQQHENLKSHISKLIPSTAANIPFFILINAASLWQNLNWKPFNSFFFLYDYSGRLLVIDARRLIDVFCLRNQQKARMMIVA
jgi:hypothetical protein